MIKNKMISILLCIICCINLPACAGTGSSEETSAVSHSEEHAAFIPEEITMEFFGVNLLEINRPMWEEYIFSLNDIGEEANIRGIYPIGDYEVTHSYMNFENGGNFSSVISYNDVSYGAAILFGENNKLTKIDIQSNMGEEFCTSFFNIGDNVKDYFESFQKGSWEKFLADDKTHLVQEWVVRHSTAQASEFAYDVLQVYNNDIYISYMIKDECVEHIMLSVIGELPVKEDFETESSIYRLNSFDYYINGQDISEMTCGDWLEFFNYSEDDETQRKMREQWLSVLDFSDEHFKKGEYQSECWGLLEGKQLGAYYTYYEDREWKSLSVSICPVTNGETPSTDDDIYRTEEGMAIIGIDIGKAGSFNVDLYVDGECTMITSNSIMPGDNIRTFFNAYEDGLYEEIMSLSDPTDEYTIGPYYFSHDKESQWITIGKHDARSIMPLMISYDNEIVTKVNRIYRGNVSDFDEEPAIW